MPSWVPNLTGAPPRPTPEEAEQAAYWASPLGRAEAARYHGQGFVQIELPISAVVGESSFGSDRGRVYGGGGHPDLLSQIEAKGWRLEHVGYVFVETGSTSTNHFLQTGQGTVTRGQVVGIYLFRTV
jgi:hypothetical protein